MLLIVYIVLVIQLLSHFECKKTSSEEGALSDGPHYWDSSSEEKGVNTQTLSLRGKLRRQFALSLFLQNPTQSAVCSPVSALLPLGKMVLGASGKTMKELLESIGAQDVSAAKKHFKSMIKNLKNAANVSITICSGIYLSDKDTLQKKFKSDAEDVFGVGVETVDFTKAKAAADKINDWVSMNTNHKINNLIKQTDLTDSASLVLVNAIYFSGQWRQPFKKAQPGIFTGSRGTQNVHMMHQLDTFKYYFSSTLCAELVEIPYESKTKAAMIIVLPKSMKPTALTILLKQLKVAPDLLRHALKKMAYAFLSFKLPKFKIETKFDLGEQYKNIGLTTMFSKGLNKIVQDKDLTVSRAVQAAMIDVDENGTTAAAASATYFVKSAVPSNRINVTVDHPFLFILQLRDQQLFSGVVNEIPDSTMH